MKTMPEFKLQFAARDDGETSQLICQYAGKYLLENDNKAMDLAASNAGASIRNGESTYHNFRIIYEWKLKSFLKRGFAYLNPDNHDKTGIERALRDACNAQTVSNAIRALIRFDGVKIPVASAVLAMIRPDRYTVLDVRALRALGVSKAVPSIAIYEAYLQTCVRLAARYNVDLRTLDRALFWFGGQQSGRRRNAC